MSTCGSARGTRFVFQHLHGILWPFITPVPGDLVFLSDFREHQAHVFLKIIHADKTLRQMR